MKAEKDEIDGPVEEEFELKPISSNLSPQPTKKNYWKYIAIFTSLALLGLIFSSTQKSFLGDVSSASEQAFQNIFENGTQGESEELLETIDLNNPETHKKHETAKPAPEPAPIYRILITEILFNPQGGDKGKEFIKLYNEENIDVDLAGWSLKMGTQDQTSLIKIGGGKEDKTIIKAKGEFLAGFNSFGGVSDTKRSASLPNAGATITLNNKDNVIMDAAIYESLEEGQSWIRSF